MPASGWYLETCADGRIRRLPIDALPFRVGRRLGLDLVIPAASVSKVHAEIYASDSGVRVRDLGSRNGTFVNRTLVEDAALGEGDVLHFADAEFLFGRSERTARAPAADGVDVRSTADAVPLPRLDGGTREFRELLDEARVTIAFQPIVQLSSGEVFAHEALGRGRHPRLPEDPCALFSVAETIDAEAELSRLFRRKAVELAAARDGDVRTLFLNTHPLEVGREGLLESLEELRVVAPSLQLALEVHESVLTHPSGMAELRRALVERNVLLAFDNFGAGRARLHELADAPPHYLKFHKRFVAGLHAASAGKRRLLQSLLALSAELCVKTVGGGIESAAEARACKAIGFTHGQGSYFGPPQVVEEV